MLQLRPAIATIPVLLVDLVLDGLASPHSRRAYGRVLDEFFTWYPSNAPVEGFTRATVQRYRSHLEERDLSAASINLHLAALRKLSHQGRAPLEQIQISLGQASIQTTERYLGLRQNLHDAPCDQLGISGWEG